MILRPQPGKQELFLASPADIVIYGGAAGGGKTYGLLLEPLRHISVPGFGAVVFRRTSVQITSQGGLWDTARGMYSPLGATPTTAPRHMYKFHGDVKVSFAHLQYDSNCLDWQGSQIPLIIFDELTHFSEYQFFYMLSRNRSTCGVRPYVRASTNPDSQSWLARFISWWIDQTTGFPIPERAGVLRYFTRISGEIVWGDELMEVADKAGISADKADRLIKSVTFIPSKLEDNQILMREDPSYQANLMALPRVERERLLDGNWKVKKESGAYFPTAAVKIIDAVPNDVTQWVRRWDLAATPPTEDNPSPDATSGVLMGKRSGGGIVIADARHVRARSSDVRSLILATAIADRERFPNIVTLIPQDPGQAGKDQAESLISMLSGHAAQADRETKAKEIRAEPLSAQWQVGNVVAVRGDWNARFLSEMDAFPGGAHDDEVDAASGAFIYLSNGASMAEIWEAMSR